MFQLRNILRGVLDIPNRQHPVFITTKQYATGDPVDVSGGHVEAIASHDAVSVIARAAAGRAFDVDYLRVIGIVKDDQTFEAREGLVFPATKAGADDSDKYFVFAAGAGALSPPDDVRYVLRIVEREAAAVNQNAAVDATRTPRAATTSSPSGSSSAATRNSA
jgi:hypothetical protein